MSVFIETQHGFVNADYVVRVGLPVSNVSHWRFEIVMCDGKVFVQQYASEQECKDAFKQTYRDLITNNG